MIMRATQKKMMSAAVTSTLVGWNRFRSVSSSGQPSGEKVHSQLENQVSRTSSSCTRLVDAHAVQAEGASVATTSASQSWQYHTGIRWPHQS